LPLGRTQPAQRLGPARHSALSTRLRTSPAP
jgi:hypothetical protein